MTNKNTSDKLHDEEVNKISTIFKKSGIDCVTFLTVDIENQSTDIDVLGIYKNIIILVECVGNEDFGPKLKKAVTDFNLNIQNFNKILEIIKRRKKSFYKRHKNDFASNEKIFKKLLVSCKKETKEYINNTHLNICNKENIFLWTMEEIYYYDKVADCTYDHCRFEIFDFLNIDPTDIKDVKEPITPTYLAYGKKINNNLYILNFVVPVKVLLERSTVKRLRDSNTSRGYQRLLDKNKLKKMRNYLLREVPVYPNNIICALNKKTKIKELGKEIKVELGEEEKAKIDLLREIKDKIFMVELPNLHNVFEIIDGQHRLFSFSQTKYHLFDKIKKDELKRIKAEDEKIKKLSEDSYLTVTAIYSKNNEWGEPGKLFLKINTTQTKIKPEDIIDLVEKYDKDNYFSIVYANKLLKKLNKKGILSNKIKFKPWQDERIKRTSLISYGGLKDIFEKNKHSYKIFHKAYKKQKKVKNYIEFCYIMINNFIWSLAELVKNRYPKKYSEMKKDLTNKNYYLFSAVFIGALIRLLRHFISEKDGEFKILNKINKFLKEGRNSKETINKNIKNEELQNLFEEGLKVIVSKYDFSKSEFEKQKGWGPNKWAKIESDLFYLIREKYPNFGDEMLISKKYRRVKQNDTKTKN